MVILKRCHIYLFIIDLLEPLVYWHYKVHDHTTVRWMTIKTGAFWKSISVILKIALYHLKLCYVQFYRSHTRTCLLEKQFNPDICTKSHVSINTCLLYKIMVTVLIQIDIPLASQNSSLFRKPHWKIQKMNKKAKNVTTILFVWPESNRIKIEQNRL